MILSPPIETGFSSALFCHVRGAYLWVDRNGLGIDPDDACPRRGSTELENLVSLVKGERDHQHQTAATAAAALSDERGY